MTELENKDINKIHNLFIFISDKKDRLRYKEINEHLRGTDLKYISSHELKYILNKNGSNSIKSNGTIFYQGLKIKEKTEKDNHKIPDLKIKEEEKCNLNNSCSKRNEYYKNYYLKNKEKMKKQVVASTKHNYPNKKRDEIMKKLNNGEYKRLPRTKIEKYNFVLNKETKLYE